MRRIVVLAISLVALGCADTRQFVTLAFNDYGQVTITTKSPKEDLWAARFNRLEPSSETITIEKSRGEVDTVSHSAVFDEELLQKFFADVDMTIRYTTAGGMNELEIYPATSSRATREEREEFDRRVHVAAQAYVDYINAMRHVFHYLDAQPGRLESVFRQLTVEHDEDVVAASEEENTLILDVRHAMLHVISTAPEEDAQARFFDLADRVNDPFPAVLTVTLPRTFVSLEGFKRIDSTTIRAEVTSPTEALSALDGKWLSPDLIATSWKERTGPNGEPMDEESTFQATIHQPRYVTPSVTADEIAKAFIEQIKPKPLYRVRWVSAHPEG